MEYKIVLDAGHGGEDPGASGNGIVEKDLTLDITKYLYERFKELNIPVKVTRLTDETLTPTERVNRVLGSYGNGKDVIVISSHINAGGGDGAEVIYPLRNTSTLPNMILSEISKEGQNIREAYQRRLPSDTSKDYYFMQRNTGNTQTLTVEYGFLDSTGDDVEQLKNNYKQYAEAVVRAVIDYIGENYVPLEGSNNYVVKRGDTLYSIANKYNTSVNSIKKLNNLNTNALSIGQVLKIPEKIEESTTYSTYTVKSGDTLYSIAKQYGLTVDELIDYNELTSNTLSVGQQLKIPVETIEYSTYTVKSGDSLWSIANKNNTSVDVLKELNGLKSNLLSVGQVLLLPVKTEEVIYVVKSGDSLWSIANKYNTTVDNIKNKNNLTNNLLSINQKLII